MRLGALVVGLWIALPARAAELQAPPPPKLPPSAAATAVQSWVAESLSLPMAPGREAAWTAAAAQALRSEPAASVEQVTARALAEVHGLAPEAARDVETLLNGRPLDSLSISGDPRGTLVGAGADAYAFMTDGLHRRTGEGWRLEGPGVVASRGYAVDGGTLYATDGRRLLEFQGGARREITDSAEITHIGPLIRYGDAAYLGLGIGAWRGLYARRGEGPWKILSETEPLRRAESAAVHEGALYVGGHGENGRGALYRFDGDSWREVLAGAGIVGRLIAHGGRLYAQTRGQTGGPRAYEISGLEAVPLFDKAVVEWLYAHGDRLYAHGDRLYAAYKTADAAWEVHERGPAGWSRVLENAGRPGPSIAAAGAELFVRTVDGLHHRDENGEWSKVGSPPDAWLSDAVAHDWKLYMATGDGVAVAGDGRVDVVAPGLLVNSMVSHGKELLLAGGTGVKRIVTGAPPGWRDALLEAFQAAVAQAAPLPAAEAPLLRDGRGRPLLGFTSSAEGAR